jgi:hypothetical protein
MYRNILRGATAALLTVVCFSGASAQVFTPTFTSPRLINEIGVHLSDGPGDLAIEGIWRAGPLGLRVGWVDAADGAFSVGGEVRSPLYVDGAPLGLAFVAGGQALLGDLDAAGLQAGLSAGYTFMGTGLAVTPYMHPRVAMVRSLGDNGDWDFEVLADVGVDAELWTRMLVRLGVNLTDIGSNWGVGLSWRR